MRDDIQSVLILDNTLRITDPTSVDWNSFKVTEKTFTHTVTQNDLERPYIISYIYFGTGDYLDLIFLLNRIENPFALRIGMELIIPSLNDMNDFVLTQKRKNFTV